jgi:hypothetical protein
MVNPLYHVGRDNPASSFAKQNWRGQYRYHGHARGVSIFVLAVLFLTGAYQAYAKED